MTFTVRKLSELYGVSQQTILGWIRSGELRAVDVSRSPGGRPRWRITETAIKAFEQLRTGTPAPATKNGWFSDRVLLRNERCPAQRRLACVEPGDGGRE